MQCESRTGLSAIDFGLTPVDRISQFRSLDGLGDEVPGQWRVKSHQQCSQQEFGLQNATAPSPEWEYETLQRGVMSRPSIV